MMLVPLTRVLWVPVVKYSQHSSQTCQKHAHGHGWHMHDWLVLVSPPHYACLVHHNPYARARCVSIGRAVVEHS